MLFVSSRAFLLSTPTFLLSAPAENSEATWKKATKCNKVVRNILILLRRKWMLPYFLFPVLQEGSILTFKYVQEQQKMVYSHSASGAADSSLTLA